MSLRTNLVLAAVLIAVSSFAYWFEFKSKGSRDRAEEAKGRLIGVEQELEAERVQVVDKLKNVEFDMRCHERCKLSDPNARWEIAAPIKFPADAGNVGTLITSIAGANVSESLPIEGDADAFLSKFGLGKTRRELSKVVIKFKKDAQPYTVYVGDDAPVGGNMYVYLEGPGVKTDMVRIVPGHLRTSLERKLGYWRSKRLFAFSPADATGLTILNPVGVVELRKEGSAWFLPGQAMADDDSVDTFLTGMAFMTAQEYVSDDKARDKSKLGLPAKPKYSVTVKTPKATERIDIYDVLGKEKQPKIYAVLSDKNFIAELERAGTEKFSKKAADFRFKQLITAAEKQDVETIDLSLGNGKERLVFARQGEAWALNSGKIEGDFDPAAVDQALTGVGTARIREFVSQKALPPGLSVLSSWSLKKKGGETLRQISVLATKSKDVFYAKLQSGEHMLLDAGGARLIPDESKDFSRQREPVAPSAPEAHGHHH